MFGGEDKEVSLLCANEMAGVVIDRFGQDIWMVPKNQEEFQAKVTVSISPQFFGWVTGIGSKMKIAGPKEVQEAYREYIRNILNLYE